MLVFWTAESIADNAGERSLVRTEGRRRWTIIDTPSLLQAVGLELGVPPHCYAREGEMASRYWTKSKRVPWRRPRTLSNAEQRRPSDWLATCGKRVRWNRRLNKFARGLDRLGESSPTPVLTSVASSTSYLSSNGTTSCKRT